MAPEAYRFVSKRLSRIQNCDRILEPEGGGVPARWNAVRKFYYEGSYDYFEDRNGRPESRNAVTTNARFRWEYQPGSELFVVYSDGRNTIGPGFPELDNRSLVVKVTKLFRF